jgi:beta-lactamase regulating signal transducer with metallopeptidase domain
VNDLLAAAGRGLAGASLSAAALAVGVGLLLHGLGRLPPAWRAWIWWLVAARALVELAGVPAWEWRVLPAESVLAPPAATSPAVAIRAATVPSTSWPAVVDEAPGTAAAEPSRARRVDPWSVVGALWLVGAAAALAVAARSAGRLRAVLRGARPVVDGPRIAALARACAAAGIRGPVALAESDEIVTPMVGGGRAPHILLPAAAGLAGEELELVLAHELAHLRRGDRWLALVPALARRLFFFHPLVALVEREFRLAVEAACDREVLARRAAPAERYGRLLVRFAAGPPTPAGAWPFAASPLRRRLEMLLGPRIDRRRLAWSLPWVALIAALVVVPVKLVAAPPAPEPVEVEELPEAPASPAPLAGARWSPSPAPLARPALPARPAALPARAPAPLPPLAPLAPLAPLPPAPLELTAVDWLFLRDGETAWMIDVPRSEQRRAERLATENGGAVVVVGRDGTSYVGRDRATIDALRGVLDEQLETARAQREVAREAARMVREQAQELELAARQAAEGAQRIDGVDRRRVERLAAFEADRMARLADQLRALESPLPEGTEQRLHALAEQLATLEEELAGLSADLGRLRELDGERLEADLERMRSEMERNREALRERRNGQELEQRRRADEHGPRLDGVLEQLLGDGGFEPLEPPR